MMYSDNPRAVASREYRRLHPDKMREYAKRRKPLTEEQKEVIRKRNRDNYQFIKSDSDRLAAYNKKRRDRYLYKRYGIKRTNGEDNDGVL